MKSLLCVRTQYHGARTRLGPPRVRTPEIFPVGRTVAWMFIRDSLCELRPFGEDPAGEQLLPCGLGFGLGLQVLPLDTMNAVDVVVAQNEHESLVLPGVPVDGGGCLVEPLGVDLDRVHRSGPDQEVQLDRPVHATTGGAEDPSEHQPPSA